jgi:hypothetical protein
MEEKMRTGDLHFLLVLLPSFLGIVGSPKFYIAMIGTQV